jgi:hypothetical protein
MMRPIKLAVLIIAMALASSGVARAQWDADDDYHQRGHGTEARQYGYQNGYRDGMKQGRHEGREHDPEDFRVPDAGQASRGYRDWMGPIWVYQNAYQDGYQTGFRAGYNNEAHAWGRGDGDADDYPAAYSGQYGGPGWGNRAYEIGFRDGASMAREDTAKNKPYNANPRGRFDDKDHGYSSLYGSKSLYRTQYTEGYRAGYDSERSRY